ncbi:MAG: serine/threonine-protein kinase [Thermodesulfobacteriota bacterium]
MTHGQPRTIGRYRVTGKLGQGAMGTVWLAEDDLIQRQVAIKSMRMDRCDSPAARQRLIDSFLHEARVVGNLNHSHITAVYDVGVEHGAPYLVMEFVNGRNIKELILAQASFPLQEKIGLLAMVARALHHAHQHGVLHRDVKPANVMILEKTRLPKITDFGIARVIDLASFGRESAGVDEESITPGTPLYMSPEQIRGKELDRRSDIFSLGVLAYEWLTGQKPFQGSNLNARLHAVLTAAPRPLTDWPPIQAELSAIVLKALAKAPEQRFQTAEEFAEALDLHLNTLEDQKASRQTTLSFDKKAIVERLRQRYHFFSDFSEEELYELFRMSSKQRFGQGEYLIQEGASGTRMFFIVSGSVLVMAEADGRRVELDTLGEGCCVGEMSMIDRMPRSASVVAIKETVALALSETVLRHANPSLCLKLYRNLAATLSERLRASEGRYLELLAAVKLKGEE